MLRVLDQLIELRALLGCEDVPEFFPGLGQFLTNCRRHRFHDLAAPFLAICEDFINLLMLSRSQIQIALHAAQ